MLLTVRMVRSDLLVIAVVCSSIFGILFATTKLDMSPANTVKEKSKLRLFLGVCIDTYESSSLCRA